MRILLLPIILLLPAAVSARNGSTGHAIAPRDSVGVLERASVFSAATARSVEEFYIQSPAAMLHRSALSLSKLALRIDLRREQEAVLLPLGDAALSGTFRANSYQRLDRGSAVWADARYIRGRRDNVRWNSTADFLLLYPHVVADSVGGTLSTEEYAFGGGYVRRIGRIDVAVRADYRAAQEYRQIDPRPHNVVSDFVLKLGAGIEFEYYTLGIDLRGRLYGQNQDIDFLDPRGANTAELFMTGLGGYFARYSGTQDCKVAYDGKGYGAGAQLTPLHGRGWYARAGFDDFAVERLYRPNNSIPVSRLRVCEATGAVAYRSECWTLRADFSCELRQGTEMIADRSGQGAIVDEQTMYENRVWKAGAEATVEWRRGAFRYTLQPSLAWWRSAASYVYPARSMTLSQFRSAVRGGVERLGPRWRFALTAGIGCSFSPDARSSLAGVEAPIAEYLGYTAERITERAVMSEFSLRAERRLKHRTACFAEAGWRPAIYAGGSSAHAVTAACGIFF